MPRIRPIFLIPAVLVAACYTTGPALAAKSRPLSLRHVTLDLPGPPSKVMPADLDGDGRIDLLVVVAYTEIEEIGEDRIENLIQITTVIPAVFDRREVRAYLATPSGGFEPAGEPLELPRSVLHMEPGPDGAGILALTDTGVARLVFSSDGTELQLEPWIEDVPVLARTQSFYASLDLVHDVDGDGLEDLQLPGRDGLAIYPGTATGLASRPVGRIDVSSDRADEGFTSLWYPLPTVQHVDGDELPDLVFAEGFRGDRRSRHVMLGTGGGRFSPIRDSTLDCHDRLTDLRYAVAEPEDYPWPRDLTVFRDLDGDGRAEAVIKSQREVEGGWRKELKDAKRPVFDYRFHRLRDDLSLEPEPYFELEVVGYSMESDADDPIPFQAEQFEDLDGDGREDLVTVTLDFSILQALRVLATKKIKIGVDFHIYAQQVDGSFRKVDGLDLSEKLKFNLNKLELGRFAQFAGDFDGDGLQDFVHLGRGKTVTIHTGQPGCRYRKKPDLTVELEKEAPSLDLVSIEDIDGDGRSDISITRPLEPRDADETAPVRLDLYLSGAE